MKSTSDMNKLSKFASKRKRSLQETEASSSEGGSSPVWPTAGQRPRVDSQVTSPSEVAVVAETQQDPALSEVAKAHVADEWAKLERDIVQLAILEEKKEKLQAMVDGSREVPRELKANRSLPSLGSYYSFTSAARLEAEEMYKRQDSEYVTMLLNDLKTVSKDARNSVEESVEVYKQRALKKVKEEQKGPAGVHFDEGSTKLIKDPQAPLQKRRPPKQKRPSSTRPSKRPRYDGKKKPHQHRRKPKNKKQ